MGGIQNAVINKQITNTVQNAYSCYKAHLKKQKKEAASKITYIEAKALWRPHLRPSKKIKDLESDEMSLIEKADRLINHVAKERKNWTGGPIQWE